MLTCHQYWETAVPIIVIRYFHLFPFGPSFSGQSFSVNPLSVFNAATEDCMTTINILTVLTNLIARNCQEEVLFYLLDESVNNQSIYRYTQLHTVCGN